MWDAILKFLGWLLLMFYNFTSNYALALLLFTLLMKLVLLPFSMKGRKSMMALQRFTPKQKELEEKYKNDKEKYNVELQKLYKKEKINPLGGCLWQLLPWPIFIALYGVMREPLETMMRLTETQIVQIANVPVISEFMAKAGVDVATAGTSTIVNSQIKLADGIHQFFTQVCEALPELAGSLVDIDFTFLTMNLSETPNFGIINLYWLLPLISGGISLLSMFITQKMSGQPKDPNQSASMKVMTYMGPALSVYIGYMWPAAMSIYWIINSGLGIIQDVLLSRHYNKKYAIIDAERALEEEKERQIEEKRRLARQAKLEEGYQQGQGTGQSKKNMSNKKYKQLKEQQQRIKKDQATEQYVQKKYGSSQNDDVDEEITPDAASGDEMEETP